jgi:chorismate synthase
LKRREIEMAGSSFGTLFRVTTWGESHGAAVGAVIDGCPAGLPLDEDDLRAMLDRRKPGQNAFSTARAESDSPRILSGVFEGRTTGTPICAVIYNEDHRSADYGGLADVYRPGHADYTFDKKYGFRDYRGGGRSSGRETAGRVAAGAVAKKLLREAGIDVAAFVRSIGGITIGEPDFSAVNPLNMPDREAAAKAEELISRAKADGDSLGGVVECAAAGVPAGLGETVFDKLDADLAKAVLSIGAVKGVEFGAGFGAAALRGSENNDAFTRAGKASNNAGGILGGMADGGEIVIRAAFKPTPSIRKPQNTVNRAGDETVTAVNGRHDPVIAPRAAVVVEAMVCLVLADHLLRNMAAKLDSVKKIYTAGI